MVSGATAFVCRNGQDLRCLHSVLQPLVSASNSTKRSPFQQPHLHVLFPFADTFIPVYQNWRTGRFTNFRLPHPDHPDEGHTDDVYAVQICGKVLVSGGHDGTVRTWDLLTQRLIGTEMRGHNSGVLSLQCDSRPQHDIILTGSSDGELISWRFSTRSAMRVLRHAHSAEVLDIKLDSARELVVTNSADLTIKIWELEGMENSSNLPVEEPLLLSRVISGHQVWVNGIDLCGDTLVGACVDRTVRVWNVQDGTCVKTVVGDRSVACIGMIGDRILCGGADCMVTVWDSRLDRAEGRLRRHSNDCAIFSNRTNSWPKLTTEPKSAEQLRQR